MIKHINKQKINYFTKVDVNIHSCTLSSTWECLSKPEILKSHKTFLGHRAASNTGFQE